MKAQVNTPCTVCKVMVIVAIVAMAVASFLGCKALNNEGAVSKTQIGTALQLAYENGGREAISNRIEQLVVEGKLSGEQAVRLQALADIACERVIEDLVKSEALGTTNSIGNAGCSDGCTTSPPCDASGGGETGKAQPGGNVTSS